MKITNKLKASLIISLFILSMGISAAYISTNPPNKITESEHDVYYTFEYSREGNHITVIRTPHYTPKDPFADLPEELKPIEEEQESLKLGLTPPPYEPPQIRSTGDQDYLIQPTAFTDDNVQWNTEASAYDWNNATNAETTASANDANDLDLHTFNTTDNSGETITYVDIYIRADWSFTGNDYVTVKWHVGATQGVGTFTMNAGNSADDQIISFENVAEPNDASWSWADIGNILIEFDEERVAGNDLVYVRIDETWGWLDVVGVTPDTTDPDVDSPADQEVELGSTSNSITWTVGDQNPNNYIIYRNDSNVESGAWTNGTLDADSGECDGLSVGIYNFTLWVDDDNGNSATDIVWFTVSDQTAPVLTSPADDQYNEGSSSNTISWTVTELSPNDYIVYKNGSVHDSGVYSDGVPLNIDIDGQSLGIYNFTIWVDDDYGSEDTDEVWITVVDGTDPSLDSPVDIQYSEGSTSNIITWTATETNPDTYEVWQNGTPYDSGAYSNGVGIPINVDGLSLGFYNFTMRVNDTTNNFATDEVIVEVYDGTDPTVDSPSNVDYELGSTSNLLTWVATDTNANNYTVYKNGTIWSTYDSQSWTSGIGIEINIDGLPVGYYNFTIFVHDIAYNGDSDEVIVHVTDTTDPLIDSPIDDSIELGSTIDDITWTGNDLDTNNYEVFKNSSSWDSGNWEDSIPIVVQLDTLPLGLWNFTIILYDSSGNSVTDLVWITCEDNTNPEINNPGDDSYQLGSSSNTIVWLATDLSADNYTVYKNGTIWSTYDSQSWTSGVNIVINIDGLPVGFYNFTIYVMDATGNSISDEVIIQVTEAGDETDPVISAPADQEIELGSITDDISWTITEINPDTYIVYKNNSNVEENSFSNGIPIVFELDSFTLGLWNVTIWANDTSANIAVDLCWITVSDSVNPQVNSPADFWYELGSSSNTVEWTASDLSAFKYYIYRNETQVDYNTWITEVQVQLGIDGLSLGIYNFTVIFYDVSLNYIIDLLWLTVSDNTDPNIDHPADQEIELGSSTDQISWTCTDLASDTYIIYQNNSNVDSNSWSSGIAIIFELDSFILGTWNVTIICFDSSSNNVIDLVWIVVSDSVNPEINSPADDEYTFGSTGNTIIWVGIDLDADLFEVFKNGSTHDSGAWVTSVNIVVNVDGFVLGIFNLTIIIWDGTGNHIVDIVWITVSEAGSEPPTISSPANKTIIEGSTGNRITWNVLDDNPYNYTLFVNGIFNLNGTWITGLLIINIDGLSAPYTWNITLLIQDYDDNQVFDSVFVKVIRSSTYEPYKPNTFEVPEDVSFEVFIVFVIVILIFFSLVMTVYISTRKVD